MNVRRTIETTTYVALSAAIGFISFLILVPTLAAGVPLLLLALAGAPLIAAAFVYCHLLARLERRRAAALLGAEFPTRAFPREGSVPVRALSWMSSRGSWLELLYALIALPFVGWLGGTLVFGAWGAALGLLSYPLWGWATPGDDLFGLSYLWAVLVHVTLGAGALYAAPWLGRGVAAVQLAMARLLLEPGERERLSARVDTLEETRAGMVAAADAERRRIERDLHDGAQQRLVALAMTLGPRPRLRGPDPHAAARRRGPR